MGIYEEGYVGFREGIVLLGFRKFTQNTLKPNKNKSESTGFTSLTCIKSLGFPFDGFIFLMIEFQHTIPFMYMLLHLASCMVNIGKYTIHIHI